MKPIVKNGTALTYAKLQLDGAVSQWEVIVGYSSRFACRKCGQECYVEPEMEPCAFCNDCKDDVLTMVAQALVKASAPKARRPRRKHDR